MSHRFKHALLWFGEIILLLLIVLVWLIARPQSDSNHNPNQPKDAAQATVSAPSVQNRSNPLDTTFPPRADKNSKLTQFLDKAETDPIVLLTIALFLVGTVQAGTYIETLKAHKAVQRAFLAPIFKQATFQEGRLNFEIVIDLKNTGVTPAHDLLFRADIRVVPFQIPETFDYPLPSPTGPQFPSFLAPGATKFIARTLPYTVPDTDIVRIKRLDGLCLLMWGVVTYRDVFKKNHTMKFAYTARWIPRVGTDTAGNPLPEIVTTSDAPRHNGTD